MPADDGDGRRLRSRRWFDNPADPAMTQYVSDDVKLSDFTGHTMEAKLGVRGDAFDLGGRWASARFEGILEYAIQNNRFGNAVIAHVAVTIPFSY